mmetsp:Transcript_34810/g.75906  ORF Transcript_34810/g.75906 Transcript_34810/m.75906 type:complete len:407 (-) Transcript_34810:92-1312(-)
MAVVAKRKDPLLLLREFTVAKKKVKFVDDYLDFDDRAVHRSTKCGFRVGPSGPLIDIGSVWYMLHEISGGSSYTPDVARKRGFVYIGVVIRGDLCDYLCGRVEKCPGLVTDVIEGRKQPKAEHSDRAKRQRIGDGKKDDALVPSVEVEISNDDVAARVRPVKDLDLLLRCPGRAVPNADLILKIAQEEYRNWNRKERAVERSGVTPFYIELESMLRRDAANLPLILVPCNKNSPVNLLNAEDLLGKGIYRRPNQERRTFFESTRPESVQVTRSIRGKPWTFEIRDSAAKFTKEQWLRTVAVITDGSDWQFKGWPFEHVVDLWATCRGVFFQEFGTLLPVHVSQWSVVVLPLPDPQAGGVDHRAASIRDSFFTAVENFMKAGRPKKFVNHTQLDGERRLVEKARTVL